MNRVLLAALATLALSTTLDSTVNAQTAAFNPYVTPSTPATLSPADVVSLAQQGYLREQGIPSSGALIAQYQFGTITAKAVVDGAIKANRLPAQAGNDRGYIQAVNNQLQVISSNR